MSTILPIIMSAVHLDRKALTVNENVDAFISFITCYFDLFFFGIHSFDFRLFDTRFISNLLTKHIF